MPHTKSAKKRLRQTTKRRLHNRAVKKDVKIQVKKILAAPKDATVEQLEADLKLAAKKLDKAAAKRVLHPNTAARRKSRLARTLNARKAAAAPAS